jgi:hypothetical protein
MNDIDKATRAFLLDIAEFDGTPGEVQRFDELVEMTAKFVREQIQIAQTAPSNVVFTLLFHKDLTEEDAIDIDIAIKALAIISARRGGGIVIRSCKPDGGQVDVPVLVPMGEAPKGVN